MRIRTLALIAVVGCFVSGVLTPALADKGEMRIQFGTLFSAPTSDLVDGSGNTLELENAWGIQTSFEYKATDLIGIEPAIALTRHDVELDEPDGTETVLGEIDLFALTVNLNFHLLKEKKIDLYLGPTVGYAFWGDLETDLFPQDFPADDNFLYGLNLGVDVPFGKSNWEFSGALNYLITDVTLEGAAPDPDLGVDPLQVKIGVAYKF